MKLEITGKLCGLSLLDFLFGVFGKDQHYSINAFTTDRTHVKLEFNKAAGRDMDIEFSIYKAESINDIQEGDV